MAYPAYLLCLGLMIPAFALTALIVTMMLVAAGPKDGWSVLVNSVAFFGAGLVEPLRYGWRLGALLAGIVLVIGAGAIPGLRDYAFYLLALVAAACAAFCL